jgi:hypothetical protein
MSRHSARCSTCSRRWYHCECGPPCGEQISPSWSKNTYTCELVHGHLERHSQGRLSWDGSSMTFDARREPGEPPIPRRYVFAEPEANPAIEVAFIGEDGQ